MTGWWHGAVGYEVYPRSFCDSNDDGIGDIKGITSRLPYLSWLGIDAVWIAPFYRSPGLDHGYDVSDYRSVNPIHGTLADFDELIADAHALDIRVVVDIVPNHSSSDHRWFKEALEGPDNRYRDYYLWQDPAPDGGPPNNWVSHFGGPAWTLDDASGQYYCHLFLPEQPDLNWSNADLREEFDEILRFWCDRGADGFRIDVAHGLTKDPGLRDNPQRVPIKNPDDPIEVFNAYEHLYDMDQDDTLEVFQRWNQVVAPYGAVLVGESNPRTINRVARYVHGDGLHTVFYLEPGWMHWKPEDLLEKIETVHRSSDAGISWVIDNHDNSRSATRYGGVDVGRQRSLAVMTFMMALGGFPFLWEGQELGLTDAELEEGDLEDPIATRNLHGVGRDATRTVMPWDSSHANGFSESAEPWLPSARRTSAETVTGQREDRSSWLSKHRHLIEVRRTHPDLWKAEPEWIDTPPGAVRALRRGSMLALANWRPDTFSIELPRGTWAIVYHSGSETFREVCDVIDMAPETSYILVSVT